MVRFSVLDLSPIVQGGDAGAAFANSRDLARHAEAWGYHRYWLAEHHNMPGIASAATALVIAHVAAATSTIRVGAGGIMLPNHAPIVIAEQFGTLEALYPGRIDLGLGRAPGTDQRTVRALRRDQFQAEDSFPRDVVELQALLGPVQPNQVVRAVPGADSNVPLYILGSSLFGAQLAAYLGLPFAFAAHFAPDHLLQALELYRTQFRPSEQLERPHAMVGVGVFAADSDAEARRLFSSQQQQFIQLRRGTPGPLPPPVDDMESFWSPQEKINVARSLAHAIVGSPQTVGRGIEAFLALTKADELIFASQIFDHAARLRSYEIVANLREKLASADTVTA